MFLYFHIIVLYDLLFFFIIINILFQIMILFLKRIIQNFPLG